MKFTFLNSKSFWNGLALLALLTPLYLLSQIGSYLGGHIDYLSPNLTQALQISMDANLLVYLSYTLLRMFIALLIAITISLGIGKLMATYPRLAAFLIPVIDILQSIPVMGFLTLVTSACLSLLPHSLWGAQLAVIFAMVTCQLWNMLLSVYRSIMLIPKRLRQVQKMLHLSHWSVFWHIELPFILPTLIWNAMLSMSATWFMIIAVENLVIPLGSDYISLDMPGIGGFINQANAQGDYRAVMTAVGTMLGAILLYDNLIFNPLLKHLAAQGAPRPEQKPVHFYSALTRWCARLAQTDVWLLAQQWGKSAWAITAPMRQFFQQLFISKMTLACGVCLILWRVWPLLCNCAAILSWQKLIHVVSLGMLTAARVILVLAIGSMAVLPLGLAINRYPRLKSILQPVVQLLASFPLNVFYGAFASIVLRYHLPFNFCCVIIMLAGTIWYLVFNILEADLADLSPSLQAAIQMMQPSTWVLWTKCLLPAMLPHYITGLIAASGAAWNASVLCEYIEWNNKIIAADGIGAYIASHNGQTSEILLGIIVMTVIIWLINKLLWVKLMKYTTKE